MPIDILNTRYFGGETELPELGTDTAVALIGALDATVDVIQGGLGGFADARTAEMLIGAFNAFIDTHVPGGTIAHGSQLAATSLQVGSQIGPSGTLTSLSGRTFTNGEVISNRLIEGHGAIAAGATVTFNNCRFVGSGANAYVLNCTAGGGLHAILNDCEMVQRSALSKGLVMWGDGNVTMRRSIFRGGQDNVFFNPVGSAGIISTGDSLVPSARVLAEDCWYGDCERIADSHTDCFQIDGGGFALLRRVRIMAYNIPVGSDPLTTRVTNPATASLGGGGLITTQDSRRPSQINRVAIRDSYADGGNITVHMNPTDGLPILNTAATNNHFGLRFRFDPLQGGHTRFGNVWGQSGVNGDGVNVVVGQPIPGG